MKGFQRYYECFTSYHKNGEDPSEMGFSSWGISWGRAIKVCRDCQKC